MVPGASLRDRPADGRLALDGRWTADQAPTVEANAARILAAGRAGAVAVDLSGIERLDTLGAWVLERTRAEIAQAGGALTYVGVRPEHRTLLGEVRLREVESAAPARRGRIVGFLDTVGRETVRGGTRSSPPSPSWAR